MANKIVKIDGKFWCSVCLQDIDYDSLWLSDNKQDSRHFCYDCAPDDAVRAKDLMLPIVSSKSRIVYS